MKTSTVASNSKSVLIVAAEASSNLYAQRLLEFWQRQEVNVKAFGIGSRAMESLGFEILGRSEELAVVGLQEVIAHWNQISSTFDKLVAEAAARRPRFALLLDYPDFNLRLAKKLKDRGIPVVYYISPQVWAWRTSRVHLIKKVVDHMLVVFPFEVDFYKKYDVPVEFVGHPLLDELSERYFDPHYRQLRRSQYGLQNDDVVLALMPGSRRSELKHHLETQLQVARELVKERPGLKVALLVAPTFNLEEIRAKLPTLEFPLVLMQDEPFEMINLADVILCASGTATLMVGLVEKPMVIMYKMNALTAFLARRLANKTPFFGMINLILGRMVVPELFQEQANVARLKQELLKYIDSPKIRETTRKELAEAKMKLGNKGATLRVGRFLMRYLEN